MFHYSGANGSYQLSRQGDVIVGQFSGAINERMIATFATQLETLVKEHQLQRWAYISNSMDVLAATPEAQLRMVSVAEKMFAHGCQAAAFVIDSAIAINQLEQIRRSLGRADTASDIVFDNFDDALAYVNEHLATP
ncbi:hypothetical protein [Pseudoalteromonas sp. BDTF-M6]|uniref:hypothetical protein n=1 Tax=Pseudoalteromonas sp. BDTF-M6 TaxID=2796132 RepID=UPI001BAFE4E1|nr:hypothetical protein [Pseudoalteromonas sp. BDTF-M6]MBS3796949.1 hypothetical protein [Pseudoalteromonas sp. BDTF-M6]